MTSSQTDLAREQMIEQQVRAWDVLDERVLATLRRVPRKTFVPAAFDYLTFADADITLPHGQQMLRPALAGRLLQSLGLKGSERVLEVGTGSGYFTACLAANAASVRSVELFADLAETAAANLKRAGVLNTAVLAGDAASDEAHTATGPISGQFDAIVFTASLPVYDARFQQLLTPGGRLLVSVGEGAMQETLLVTHTENGQFLRESLYDISLPQLLNARRPERFRF